MEKKGPEFQLLPQATGMWRPVIHCFQKLAALEKLERAYQSLPEASDPRSFLKSALETLRVRPVVSGTLSAIPEKGPLLVVANHPFGGLEGLLAAQTILERRSDVKIMANALLERIPEIESLIFGVDPFGFRRSRDRNVVPLRRCLEWLRSGGALVMFPSGTVSHFHLRKRSVMDPQWSPSVGRLLLWSRCPVVPMHFEGSNSLWFHLLGLLHPRLRTFLLPRELQNKGGQTIRLTIGRRIPFEELAEIGSPRGITEYLRAYTYALGVPRVECGSRALLGKRWRPLRKNLGSAPRPVRTAVPSPDLSQDIENLPDSHCVLVAGPYRVYWAAASQIPHVLREIGRLRETAFRAAGEGTGREEDLDEFDGYYDHLFLWNADSREIVGAYRIGRGDAILEQRGLHGFYTHTLFRYGAGIRSLLQKTLELGRSFVRPEYQKAYAPLWFLWKGIGRYVALHERYRFLLGPVSISDTYHVLSRHLMLMYLRQNHFCHEWGRWVRSRKPWRLMPVAPWNVHTLCRDVVDVDLFSELVAVIERYERSVPVLLRQYIKLGGKVLGFNVDPNFSYVVDALILVDLAQADLSLLEKTMGREEARRFLSVHRRVEIQEMSLCA